MVASRASSPAISAAAQAACHSHVQGARCASAGHCKQRGLPIASPSAGCWRRSLRVQASVPASSLRVTWTPGFVLAKAGQGQAADGLAAHAAGSSHLVCPRPTAERGLQAGLAIRCCAWAGQALAVGQHAHPCVRRLGKRLESCCAAALSATGHAARPGCWELVGVSAAPWLPRDSCCKGSLRGLSAVQLACVAQNQPVRAF